MSASQTTKSADGTQPDKLKPSDAKPTLQESFNKFDYTFRKARCGSDITGKVTGVMLGFLKTENLSPYYRMQACIVLSAADEDEPNENIAATTRWLKESREALEIAKQVYVYEANDTIQLQMFQEIIKDEEGKLVKRKAAFYSDDEDEDEDAVKEYY
ncbi:hypothetical protein DPSP01_004658 [Paraphaeosphaeria sporulosa]